ncbi:MAG: hypothetical protein IJR28_04540 [Ottowia sp.]|nr:hypothetical protein [Ottowia sp.]
MKALPTVSAALLACALPLCAAAQEAGAAAHIAVAAGAHEVVCTLGDSRAARNLLAQLPLALDISDYAGKEKTFSPPKKLDTSGAPLSEGKKGSLAYFAPWNNVVLFYKDGAPYPGLHELGTCTTGAAHIEKLRGRVTVSAQE